MILEEINSTLKRAIESYIEGDKHERENSRVGEQLLAFLLIREHAFGRVIRAVCKKNTCGNSTARVCKLAYEFMNPTRNSCC